MKEGEKKKKTERSKQSWHFLNSASVWGGVSQDLPVLHTARLQESLDARDAHSGQAGAKQVLATECPEQVLDGSFVCPALCGYHTEGSVGIVLCTLSPGLVLGKHFLGIYRNYLSVFSFPLSRQGFSV